MGFTRQFTALLWKNWLLKKRNPLGSLCEFLLPFLFILIMAAVYGAFKDENVANTSYASEAKSVLPFSVFPYRLGLIQQKLAIVRGSGPGAAQAADDFVRTMSAWHPALDLSTIGGSGMTAPDLRAIRIPAFADMTMQFPSEAALEAYVTSSTYDTDWERDSAAHPKIFGAIVFHRGAPDYDYSIRLNTSQTPATDGDKVDVLQRGYDESEFTAYLTSNLLTRGPPFLREPGTLVTRQPFPGFLTLQREVDRFIINASVPASSLEPIAMVTMFADAISRCLPPARGGAVFADLAAINATNPARAVAIGQEAIAWLGSEAYAPQGVEAVPFPVSAYKENGFYNLVLFILSFILVIAYVFPVSRLLRALVGEKESKIREGMRMMGLSDAALFGSWIATYAIFYALLSLVIAAVTSKTMFKTTEFGVVFLLFWLFGLSSTTFCYLVSVFFSRAKTASSVGVVLFIGAYFPAFSVNSAFVTLARKRAASLCSPTAFGLTLDLLGAYENNGAGVKITTATNVVNNWSASTGLGMLFLDFLLYAALAWYIDQVLPASIREFGVPRPWYFPFTLSYWREALNLPQPAASGAAAGPSDSGSASTTNGGAFYGVFQMLGLTKAPAASSRPSGKAPVDQSYFEAPDANLKAKEAAGRCVSVRGLRKEFPTPDGIKTAVDGVDLTMHEGQIFVLLGHNGAGKTTTISMLTGLIPPTAGTASVFGNDISTNLASIRKDLGVCPQHDVLWPELTVQEHLQLFAELKDVPRANVAAEVTKAIADVGLTEKLNARSSNLSGGQKRKLSVCIALCGGSRVIFLDEPTSGMDPYSRRSTWQILQNAREGRVMVLTTHFMDEADILGDRIGIMADGRVQCSGSPLFLKRRYGVGYVLTMVKEPACKSDAVLAMMRTHVPEASVATNVGAELSVRLPLTASPAFPAMLGELDKGAATLGVASYGISITSVEDVFLKISAGEHFAGSTGGTPAAGPAGAGGDGSSTTTITVKPAGGATVSPSKATAGGTAGAASGIDAVRAEMRAEQTGLQTFLKHFRALFLKRWNYSKRDKKALAYQILLPGVLIAAGLALIRVGGQSTFSSYQLSTAQFNADARVDPNKPVFPNYVPYFNYKSVDSDGARVASAPIAAFMASLPAANVTLESRLTFGPADTAGIPDPFGFVDPAAGAPLRDYQRMSAFLLSDKAAYPASKFGAYVFTKSGTVVPTQDATALLTAGGAGQAGSGAVTYTMFFNSTGSHTPAVFANLANDALYRSIGPAGASITARNHPLPLTNRETTVFGGLLVFSAAIIIVIAFAFVAASTALYIVREREVNAKHQQLISGVSVPAYWISNFAWDLLAFAIPAAFAIILCFAFQIKEFTDADASRVPSLVLTFVLFAAASVSSTYLLSFFFKSPSSAQSVILFVNIAAILLIAASQFMSQIQSTCRAEYGLRFVFRLLPSFAFGWNLTQLAFLTSLPLIDATCDLFNGVVRPPSEYDAYDALSLKATGTSLIYLAVQGVLYFLAVLGVEYVLSKPHLRLLFRADPAVPAKPFEDDVDVAGEAARVAAQAKSGAVSDVILLDNLRKVYAGGKVAVQGLSYGVPAGEVFGFLGINGAGKTTTLSMLSGDVLPSSGTARLAGFDIISQQPQVRRLLGYCPQFDALLELLTVREHLELFARIKGVPEASVASVVAEKLAELDLRPFANKKAGTLSGGNKRKLSVAIALIGRPPIVFLDEPSTGMDPVARRFMWSVISRVATERKQCSIILTTHSMEEVEALCTRIGIMVGGRMRCLGTAQHLKNRHGQGYIAELKLAEPTDDAVAALEAAVASATGAASPAAATISQAQVPAVATALGNPARGSQVHEAGTGWAIAAAFARSPSRTIPAREFAAWWAGEQLARDLVAFVTEQAFPGASLVERQGSQLRFRLPFTGEPLASIFTKVEGARAGLGVQSFVLGQTTLEQIFVQFASKQEEERGVARGLVATPVADPMAGYVPETVDANR